jgi:hypothetical protein
VERQDTRARSSTAPRPASDAAFQPPAPPTVLPGTMSGCAWGLILLVWALILLLCLYPYGAYASDGTAAQTIDFTPLWLAGTLQVTVALVTGAWNANAARGREASDRRVDALEKATTALREQLAQTREQMALRVELANLDVKLTDRLDEMLSQNAKILALLNVPGHR